MTVNSSTTTYDVQELRRAFPGIDPELARFDGPGGSLVPEVVPDAVAGSLRAGLCQRGGPTALGRLADETVLAARAAVARFVGQPDPGVCSPYKWFGPHIGALVADPALLETLRPDKLLPSTDAVPERFELGTLPYELLAGVTAAVEAHELALLGRLLDGLAGLSHVTVHGRPLRRTPTVLVTAEGMSPVAASERLLERGVVAPPGSFYALEAARHAGLGDGGGVRIGLSAYTTADEVDRLLDAPGDLSAT